MFCVILVEETKATQCHGPYNTLHEAQEFARSLFWGYCGKDVPFDHDDGEYLFINESVSISICPLTTVGQEEVESATWLYDETNPEFLKAVNAYLMIH